MCPAGPPADRLDAARRGRRAAALLRRPAVRALPARAARHLRGVLHPAARCTAWSPTATGTAPGWPGSSSPTAAGHRRAPGPVRGLLCRPWLLAGRRLLGAGVRHQVGGALPAGGVRAAALALERRRPALVRRPRRAAAVGRSPTASRRSSASSLVGLRRLRRHLDRLAGARPRVRGGPVLDRSTPSTPARATATTRPTSPTTPTTRHRWPTATEPDAVGPRRGRPVAAVALVLPPATSTSSTPTS